MNQPENRARWNRLSILSLVLSAGAIIPLINYIIGPIAIYSGITALLDIKKSKEKGKYLAAASVAIGFTPYWFFLMSLLESLMVEKLGAAQNQFYWTATGTHLALLLASALLARKLKLL